MPPAQHDQAQAPAGAGALPSSFRRTGWDSTPPASSALQHAETQATATPNHAPARGSPVSTPDAWQQHQAPMPRAPSDHDQALATPAGSVPRFRRTGWDYTPPASTSHPPSSVGDDVHLDTPRVLPRCSNIRLKLRLLRIMSLSVALPYRLRPTLATARSSLTLLQLPCRQGTDLSKKISGVYMKVILPKPTRRPNTMRSYLLPKPSRRQHTMWSYSRVLTVKL